MAPISITLDSRVSREEALELFRKAALSHNALLEEFLRQKEQIKWLKRQ